MKAKLKDGRIMSIEQDSLIALNDNGETLEVNVSQIESILNEGVDWEARRFELAKEYSKTFINLQHEKGRIDCGCHVPNVVEWSVEFADALIKELKKEK